LELVRKASGISSDLTLKQFPEATETARDNGKPVLRIARAISPFRPGNHNPHEEVDTMNTAIQKLAAMKTSSIFRIFAGLLTGMLLAPVAMTADAEDSFQYKALFSPSDAQQRAEARGHIMIYDGLENAVVERAMDEQFDRVEHMMFVRTRNTQPDGEVSYDDDGCD
jgi:hypothetical protein